MVMPAIYLPVMPERPIGWWSNKFPFKYPYVFASFPRFRNVKHLRKEFGIDDDVVVYCDSGGYSILTGTAIVDPYDLADFYNKSGVDIGMTLDFPPYADPHKSTIMEFDKRLELTVKASKVLVDNVKSSVQLYACIHGVNEKQFEIWRQSLELVYDWFGLALGVSPVNDPDAVLRLIHYLEAIKNEKPVHFFESGDMVCFLLIARYANRKGLSVSADSTSAVLSARGGNAYYTIMNRTIYVGKRQEYAVKNVPECVCPVCSKYGDERVITDPDLLTLHNLYILVWKYKFVNSISTESYDAIKTVLPEALPYVKALDAMLEKRGGLWDYV
jgi:tRNA-guanine family transglycosylase